MMMPGPRAQGVQRAGGDANGEGGKKRKLGRRCGRAWQRRGLGDEAAAALAQHAERLLVRQLRLCVGTDSARHAAHERVSALTCAHDTPLLPCVQAWRRTARQLDRPDVLQVRARHEACSLELLRVRTTRESAKRRQRLKCTLHSAQCLKQRTERTLGATGSELTPRR